MISKEFLDVHSLPGGQSRRFNNNKAGFKALLFFIGGDPARVVFEPTGPYHRAFESTLAKKGLPLVKVNPRQARRFAEATGKLAKTDRIDAVLLAKMGMLLNRSAVLAAASASRQRLRHMLAVLRHMQSRRAVSLTLTPSAASKIIRARSASFCGVECARLRAVRSCWRSLSVPAVQQCDPPCLPPSLGAMEAL